MLTKDAIEGFYKDVESLNLKFPVAAIAEKTGEPKGNVSRYLSRKIDPSESFITRFYKSFKIVPRETAKRPEAPVSDLQPQGGPDYRDDVISLLKEKVNSDKRLFLYAQTNQALLKTVFQNLAKMQSKADKRKLEVVQAEMNSQFELHLQALRKEDT